MESWNPENFRIQIGQTCATLQTFKVSASHSNLDVAALHDLLQICGLSMSHHTRWGATSVNSSADGALRGCRSFLLPVSTHVLPFNLWSIPP